MYDPRDIDTFIADMMLKYKGWAMLGEYFDRTCPDPITMDADGATQAVNVGRGINAQLSKLLPSRYEFALRYSQVAPDASMGSGVRTVEELLLGSTKYLNGHRIKLQVYTGYRWLERQMEFSAPGNAWTALFQVEFGI